MNYKNVTNIFVGTSYNGFNNLIRTTWLLSPAPVIEFGAMNHNTMNRFMAIPADLGKKLPGVEIGVQILASPYFSLFLEVFYSFQDG